MSTYRMPSSQARFTRHLTPASVLLAVILIAAAYWPGLSGDFLFDDFVNLNALGRYGGVQDWHTLLYYLTSGIADPTGRPVAMLSFLMDARDWPADPWPFKRTNLVIHLLVGLLLYDVLAALGGQFTTDREHARCAAALAAGIWLAHPLWASTVLYIVQRHALLAALFAIAGIRIWISSHNAFAAGHLRRGWLLAILAVPVFGLLAGLSKANGFLLPLLIGTLHLTVLRSAQSDASPSARRHRRTATALLVWLPALTLITWLAYRGVQTAFADGGFRPWTLGERLLTQPRALCHYLWRLLVPGLDATGVFADAFVPSRSWRGPWTTLPALATITMLIAVAWIGRQKRPILSAALIFYLGGHLLESSVIMLELYFEHRNYLPAALLFWPLAWWLTLPGSYRRWRHLAGVSFFFLCLLATAAQAQLWGDPLALAVNWAQQNPDSARAQAHAASQENSAGLSAKAEDRLTGLVADHPEEPQYAINLLDLRCELGKADRDDVARAAHALSHSRGLALDMNYHWLARTLLPKARPTCPRMDDSAMTQLLEAATTTMVHPIPEGGELAARRYRLLAHLALRKGRCSDALAAFNRRIDAQRRPEFAHTQAGLLATHCDPQTGLEHLRHYLHSDQPYARPSSPALLMRDRLMRRHGYWESEIEQLQTLLESER